MKGTVTPSPPRSAAPVYRSWALSLLVLLTGAGAARPQNCFNDTRYDNGTFENAYGAVSPAKTHFVMRLDPPAAATLDQVCLCWVTQSPAPNVTFDLLVWDADGPGGAPGTLLARFEDLEARNVPSHNPGAFYAYDLSAASLVVSGPVYVGPLWDASTHPGFFICTDYDGGGTQPGYFASGPGAGDMPPSLPLGVAPPFELYAALGLRAVFTEVPGTLRGLAELIVPGYSVDLGDSNGPTTLFGLRNTSSAELSFAIEYHGNEVTDKPRRVDTIVLGAEATYTHDVRADPSGLDPEADGLAEGLAFVRRGEAGPLPLEGDTFQVDFGNDFAAGDRMVRPEDFCGVREIRFLDFGNGTRLKVLLDRPLGEGEASFTYDVYDQSGDLVASGEYFTSNHLNVFEVSEIAPPDVRFGTIVFDLGASLGGWVGARYSAFGRFSVELGSACRDSAGKARR